MPQSGYNQNTPPSQQWQAGEGAELQPPAATYREQQNRTPDNSHAHGHGERAGDRDRERDRREYRNSGWGPGRPPQNGGVGVTGAG